MNSIMWGFGEYDSTLVFDSFQSQQRQFNYIYTMLRACVCVCVFSVYPSHSWGCCCCRCRRSSSSTLTPRHRRGCVWENQMKGYIALKPCWGCCATIVSKVTIMHRVHTHVTHAHMFHSNLISNQIITFRLSNHIIKFNRENSIYFHMAIGIFDTWPTRWN